MGTIVMMQGLQLKVIDFIHHILFDQHRRGIGFSIRSRTRFVLVKAVKELLLDAVTVTGSGKCSPDESGCISAKYEPA